MKPTLKYGIIALVAIILLLIYYLFDPMEVSIFPPCPSHLLTGYDCPGCGTQRALHAFLHGDIQGVIRYNAMLLIGVPLVLAIYASTLFRKRYPRFHRFMHSNYIIAFAAAITVFWTIYRNL